MIARSANYREGMIFLNVIKKLILSIIELVPLQWFCLFLSQDINFSRLEDGEVAHRVME